MKTLEQERAKFAYEKVMSVKGKSFEEEYARYVKSAPALILTNGLGNTLAFFRSKKKDGYDKLLEHIAEWLRRREYCGENEDPLKWIADSDSIKVLQATREVLAMLNWAVKFAKAELKESDRV